MDIGIFDSLDDDGQLTLFGLEEDFGELPEPLGESGTGERSVGKETAKGAGRQEKRPARKETQEDSGEQEAEERTSRDKTQEPSGELPDAQGDACIRIRRCSSCGKMLFVREEDGGYYSACNTCGIQYVQK